MEDRAAGRAASDDLDLPSVERRHLIRRETLEVQSVRRVCVGHGEVGKLDLVEARQFHRPEDIAPCFVQRVDGAVFPGAPSPKGAQRRGGITLHRIMTAIFIVRLPGDDAGMRAERLGDLGDDAIALACVTLVTETVVTTRAELAWPAFRIQRNHVGHFVDQPFRRRRRWRAEHDLETGGVQNVDRALQPAEVVDAGSRLQPRPGEFADTHESEADVSHHGGVLGPA